MFGIGTPELIMILIVALIVLGPRRPPGIAKAIGNGLREFRRGVDGYDDPARTEPPTATTTTPPTPAEKCLSAKLPADEIRKDSGIDG